MNADSEPLTILVVDDMPANIAVLSNVLSGLYRVKAATSGAKALELCRSGRPPRLVLLDVMMPVMDGYEVCRRFKADARLKDIPIIFISALSETLDKVTAFGSGGIDYITKPFQPDEVRARVATHLKLRRYQMYLEELVDEKVRQISESQLSTIFALSKLSESRDNDTGRHLERVQSFCRILAGELQRGSRYVAEIDEAFVQNITLASILHDIGKVSIPDAVLLKPGKLSPEEFEVMKTHTVIGEQTLLAVTTRYPGNEFIVMGTLLVRGHHERWDGKGYPDGRTGDVTPLPARIMAVADVYDALRSRRCYKIGFDREKAKGIVVEGRGTQFDPDIVDAFLRTEDVFDQVWRELL